MHICVGEVLFYKRAPGVQDGGIVPPPWCLCNGTVVAGDFDLVWLKSEPYIR
jgi:hypothetical protein